jgi:hypothetical protein
MQGGGIEDQYYPSIWMSSCLTFTFKYKYGLYRIAD